MIALLPWSRWILAVHLIAVIAWMAGIFYLPRLFVYHCQVVRGSTEELRFRIMERRLLRAIMNPAMIVAAVCGAVLALIPGLIDWGAGWWWAKLVCAIGVLGFHGACAAWRRGFETGANRHPERFYRMMNEVPTVLMVVIVVAIVVRP